MKILDYDNRATGHDIGFFEARELKDYTDVHAIFVKNYEKYPIWMLRYAWDALSPFGFLYLSINLTETYTDSDEFMELVDLKKWKVLNSDMIEQNGDKIFQIRLGPIKDN